MDYKIASVATKWWIEQIKKRCLELYPKKVMVDHTGIVIIDNLLENEISRFEKVLFAQILQNVQSNLYLSLTCYFWPSALLGVLVRKANISKDYFPHRAQMEIYDNSIYVSINGEDLRKLSLPSK